MNKFTSGVKAYSELRPLSDAELSWFPISPEIEEHLKPYNFFGFGGEKYRHKPGDFRSLSREDVFSILACRKQYTTTPIYVQIEILHHPYSFYNDGGRKVELGRITNFIVIVNKAKQEIPDKDNIVLLNLVTVSQFSNKLKDYLTQKTEFERYNKYRVIKGTSCIMGLDLIKEKEIFEYFEADELLSETDIKMKYTLDPDIYNITKNL